MTDVIAQETPIAEAVDNSYVYGRSRTAAMMQVEPLMSNLDLEAKVRTIDKYIDDDAEPELRGSDLGYKLGLEKLMQATGISYMEEMKKGNNLRIIERLFASLGLKDRVSSGTFLARVREDVKRGKVDKLKAELKALGVKK